MATLQGPGGVVVVVTCKPDWTPCEKKQAKAKAAHLQSKTKLKIQRGAAYDTARARGDYCAAKFREDSWKLATSDGPVKWRKSNRIRPQGNEFADSCQASELMESDDPVAKAKTWQADHKQEVKLGGPPEGPFWLISQRVNGSFGSQLKNEVESLEAQAAAQGKPPPDEIDDVELKGCD